MIRHVVMWRLKNEAEGGTKQENMEKMAADLYALRPIIPEILRMEIGFDVSHTEMSADFVLLTEFDSLEALHTYAVHPEHQLVAKYVRSVIDSRTVIDTEI